jgi:hypothetical protein
MSTNPELPEPTEPERPLTPLEQKLAAFAQRKRQENPGPAPLSNASKQTESIPPITTPWQPIRETSTGPGASDPIDFTQASQRLLAEARDRRRIFYQSLPAEQRKHTGHRGEDCNGIVFCWLGELDASKGRWVPVSCPVCGEVRDPRMEETR